MNLRKIAKWIGRRAKEPSTYTGIAAIAAVAGAPALGAQIGVVGQAIGLIVGGGLIAHQQALPG